jgi:hypothetical protein
MELDMGDGKGRDQEGRKGGWMVREELKEGECFK